MKNNAGRRRWRKGVRCGVSKQEKIMGNGDDLVWGKKKKLRKVVECSIPFQLSEEREVIDVIG